MSSGGEFYRQDKSHTDLGCVSEISFVALIYSDCNQRRIWATALCRDLYSTARAYRCKYLKALGPRDWEMLVDGYRYITGIT